MMKNHGTQTESIGLRGEPGELKHRERINGTVAEPVVTPPESKINGINAAFSGFITTKIKSMKVIA